MTLKSYLRLYWPPASCCNVDGSTCGGVEQMKDSQRAAGRTRTASEQQNSLFSHAGVFQDVHID